MDITALAQTLHPLERSVVPHLTQTDRFSELVVLAQLKDVEVMRALQWLQNKKALTLKDEFQESVSLDVNGSEYFKIGLPEKRFLESISKEISVSELKKKAQLNDNEINICIGLLKRQKLIDLKKEKELRVSRTQAADEFLKQELPSQVFIETLAQPRDLATLSKEEQKVLQDLKRRQGVIKIDITRDKLYTLTDLGKKLTKVKFDKNVVDSLTPQMLKKSEWKDKKFRHYDVTINVPKISAGRRHFVNESIAYIKRIWLDMGFAEMTGPMVHTAYWDLDSLFVPQDHPARTMQDTFYLGEKAIAKGSLPKDHTKIKDVHESGKGVGGTGWMYKWSPDEAKKLLLRTHTTVLSAKKLQELTKDDLPAKFFNVGKVFRNEALDWKHLFEFYQVDGIVVDPQANFKHLKGYLRQFFKKMGYPDVRIRPAHFPYTEPSVEVDVWHPKKKQWVELGGAGIFRPEVVKPLLGIDVPVLAWGLGMGRIISEYYSITDIRDLYRNDLKQLREMKTWMRGSY